MLRFVLYKIYCKKKAPYLVGSFYQRVIRVAKHHRHTGNGQNDRDIKWF